jgi:predicted HAD superfamily Cof-like phosphohydrolase
MSTDRTKFESYFRDSETVDIAQMHDKFWGNVKLSPSVCTKEVLLARADFIQEELNEFRSSVENGDYLEQIDALVDMVVVAKGTAVMMGLRWKWHWDEVHRANLMKEIGKNEKRPDMPFDLIKPEGWIGPNHLSVFDARYDRP